MIVLLDTKCEYRKDGWPLCPRCGDDELYHLNVPLVAQGGVFRFRCYFCHWGGFLIVEEARV